MNYCSHCGGIVTLRVPAGDSRERYICEDCEKIHYQNPRLVVGTLPRWEDKLLLCLRSIEPRRGFWTLPSGFLENGETVQEGACRETLEEAGARVTIVRLFSVFSLPHVSQVYLTFLADLNDLDYEAGEETEEVRLVGRDEIPWDRIAFRAIEFALRRYFYSPADPGEVHIGEYERQRDGLWIRGKP